MNNIEIDKALCDLNAELLRIMKSDTYRSGIKKEKIHDIIWHINFKRLYNHWKYYFCVSRREARINQRNNEFFYVNDSVVWPPKKIAIYTCSTGNYDQIKEPCFCSDYIDYFLVTDQNDKDYEKNESYDTYDFESVQKTNSDHEKVIEDKKKISKWKRIDIQNIPALSGNTIDNVRAARYVKTHPHILFPDYEYSIWIDANIRPIGDLSKYIRFIGSRVPFASFWHPMRNCIYDEAKACSYRKKDNKNIMEKQIETYRREGMPKRFGLIETNCIVRKHNETNCIKLMEDWWKEIKNGSRRDQLSLPYVIWKNGYTMRDLGFIAPPLRNNPSFRLESHSSSYNTKR